MTTEAGKPELDLMRSKEKKLKQRMSVVMSSSYECIPLNQQQFTKTVSQLFQPMKLIDPDQKDLNQYDEIILGKIQGLPASTNFKQIIQSIVGEVREEKFKAYLKQKTQQKNYVLTIKDKNCSVRQVKKLQLLKKYFDINQITRRRRQNHLYRASTKSLSKYFELYNKVNETDSSSIGKALQQYNNYIKEEKKFIAFRKELEANQTTPQKEEIIASLAYQVLMIKEIVQQGVDILSAAKISQIQISNQIKKIAEQKNQYQQNQNKTPQKSSKSSKLKEPKKNQVALNNINNSEDAKEKQNKHENEYEKIEQKSGKKQEQNSKQKQKVLQKQKQKTIKKSSNRSIFQFFSKKKEPAIETVKKGGPEEEFKQQSSNSQHKVEKFQPIIVQNTQKGSIWDTILHDSSQPPSLPIQQLRSELKSYQMQNQQLPLESYFINMVITLSTIEYYDYPMHMNKKVQLARPFSRLRDVYYFEDQSEQFQGESADEEKQGDQQQEEQDSQHSGNNTIMNDDHLSFQEISSQESHQLDLKVQYGKANKWFINFSKAQMTQTQDQDQICQTFAMICLQTAQKLPLRLQEQQQKVEFILTAEIWRDIYQIAHGYTGTKESMVRQISLIIPGVSKNWIDTMLKQRSQKNNNQRFIKRQFIQDIRQKVPDIEQLLQKILNERNQELNKIKAQKNQQKNQKLQKDIFQCIGSRYIVNILKHLKQKGYKNIRRNELMQFINQRNGQEWDKIKIQMNTMSRPIVDMIKNMEGIIRQKIDQEVVVDDQEYNKVEKKDDQANSKASTGQKNGSDKQILKQRHDSIFKSKGNKGKLSAQQQKKAKIKKRISKLKSERNIYEKIKPINRARKTKNSLKTGIPTLEELKDKKQQQKAFEYQQAEQAQVMNQQVNQNGQNDSKDLDKIQNQQNISQSCQSEGAQMEHQNHALINEQNARQQNIVQYNQKQEYQQNQESMAQQGESEIRKEAGIDLLSNESLIVRLKVQDSLQPEQAIQKEIKIDQKPEIMAQDVHKSQITIGIAQKTDKALEQLPLQQDKEVI